MSRFAGNPKAKSNTAAGRWPGEKIARAAGLAAIFLTGLVLAGCGLGPGKDMGDAGLLVTRDYGREVLVANPEVAVSESSDAMSLLDGNADLETSYGGEYVQSVDGIAGGTEAGRRSDWFYSVNGVVAERGSAQFPVRGGDLVWWDYRDWTDAMEVGAVVGAYPAPFTTGYDERGWGVEIDCSGEPSTCGMVRNQLEEDGAELNDTGENMRLLVGTWDDLKDSPEGRRLAQGPGSSGVFGRFGSVAPGSARSLLGLDDHGNVAGVYSGEVGLVAAMRQADAPPVWLVTGLTPDGVRLAAGALNATDLGRRYAAVVSDGQISSLPIP